MAGGFLAVTLTIDTSDFKQTTLVLQPQGVFHKFKSDNLSQNLMLEIKKFLKKNKSNLSDLKKIEVRTGAHFSRTRTTVAVANSLIYALKLRQKMFSPVYSSEPNITWSNK